MEYFLEKTGSIDKALRLLFANPKGFLATVKRTLVNPKQQPY
jgi:hypothetical protein